MRGKAQRDSPVLVLLAPPGEYDWMFTQLWLLLVFFYGMQLMQVFM